VTVDQAVVTVNQTSVRAFSSRCDGYLDLNFRNRCDGVFVPSHRFRMYIHIHIYIHTYILACIHTYIIFFFFSAPTRSHKKLAIAPPFLFFFLIKPLIELPMISIVYEFRHLVVRPLIQYKT
jgi:hypothetical protein